VEWGKFLRNAWALMFPYSGNKNNMDPRVILPRDPTINVSSMFEKELYHNASAIFFPQVIIENIFYGLKDVNIPKSLYPPDVHKSSIIFDLLDARGNFCNAFESFIIIELIFISRNS
jgi:hypothetical protein